MAILGRSAQSRGAGFAIAKEVCLCFLGEVDFVFIYNSSITLHRASTSSFRLDQEVAKRMTVWVSSYFSQ